MKTFYAAFDTNVLVSALMSKHADSPTLILQQVKKHLRTKMIECSMK